MEHTPAQQVPAHAQHVHRARIAFL